jgi:hypothetical protein
MIIIYPITEKLKSNIPPEMRTSPAVAQIIETVGEYEHGTADVNDVGNVTLKQYAAVALDLALAIGSTTPDGKPVKQLDLQDRIARAIHMRNRLASAMYNSTLLAELLQDAPNALFDMLNVVLQKHNDILGRQ